MLSWVFFIVRQRSRFKIKAELAIVSNDRRLRIFVIFVVSTRCLQVWVLYIFLGDGFEYFEAPNFGVRLLCHRRAFYASRARYAFLSLNIKRASAGHWILGAKSPQQDSLTRRRTERTGPKVVLYKGRSLASIMEDKRRSSRWTDRTDDDSERAPEEYIPASTPQTRVLPWLWIVGLVLVAVVGVVIGVVIGTRENSTPPSTGTANRPMTDEIPLAQDEAWLRASSVTAGLEFDDPNSYQSRALEWIRIFPAVESVDEDGLPVLDRAKTYQRFALACIYYATNSVPNAYTVNNLQGQQLRGWLDETGWLENDDECTWKGLSCNEAGEVTIVNLSSNILTGQFPRETAYLVALKQLDISNNMMYNQGSTAIDWLGELTYIEGLYLSETFFEYNGLPPVLGKLTNLVELDVSYTLFYGTLDPSIFADLQKLESLELSGLSFHSQLPSELGGLPNLRSLYMVYSDIEGNLNALVEAEWPELYEMWLDNNPGLTGGIPAEISRLEQLASLSVSSCDLTGQLPETLGDLSNMEQMFFFNNSLSGTVPDTLANLKNLDRLQLEINSLTGAMPQGICYNRVAQLQTLHADCNVCGEDGGCCTCCGPDCAGRGQRRRLSPRKK